MRNGHGIDGDGVSPFFSDILSISRGIFKWLCQQQVVNPFFKGSTATVRFEVARVKRTPSGDLFVFFTPSLTAASFRPVPGPLAVPPKPRSRHEPANLCTFSNHAISFPIPLLREVPSTTTRVTRGKRISCHWKFVAAGSACLPLNWYNGYHVTSLFDFLPESLLKATFLALEIT